MATNCSSRWCLLVLVLLLGGLGCGSRPKAPVLRDDPVYENEREGFRFLAPEGWTQRAKADLPPGRVTKERPLVDYRNLQGSKGATFRVSVVDLTPPIKLEAYLLEPAFGVERWTLSAQSPLEKTKLTGTLFAHTGMLGKEAMVREVACYQREERVYLFTALYSASDLATRDKVKRSFESILWQK